ncbi:hypothetical protein QR680_015677 [Steinernema hermaphroditum]|uniref:Cytochrome P450 n=1 Tax=Steinernema hermaphroditum TaxID=289476 RepID=A0AA39LLB6_9BILA|nr:hypothetical protein QR680_015677 [Steinernema hermaphroditum]
MLTPVLLACFAVLIALKWRAIAEGYRQWRRKHELAAQIPGYPTWPILGHLTYFNIDPYSFFCVVIECSRYVLNSGGTMMKFMLAEKMYVLPLNGETVKDIVDDIVEIKKGHDYEFLLPWLGSGLLISYDDKWRTRRKMLTPTFHFKMLDAYIHTFDEESQLLTKVANQEKEIDVFPYIKRCALDIICTAAMGIQMNAQTTDSEYVHAVERISTLLFQHAVWPWFAWKPIRYLFGYGFESDRLVKTLTDFTKDVIKNRAENFDVSVVKDDNKKLAFLDMLLAFQKENKLSYEDIREEVDTFMFEGHDTTSSGIGWTLWCLACHPEIEEKVYHEIRDQFGDSDRSVTVEDLKELKYLERCIKESMRLFPPVPSVQRTLRNEFVIGGKTLPKGCDVVINAVAIHRNPHVYENPDSYDPDRFLPENASKRHPYDYIPFSAGPRNCIGQKFALNEEKVVLSWILRKFKVSTSHKLEDNHPLPKLTLCPEMGIPLLLQSRD